MLVADVTAKGLLYSVLLMLAMGIRRRHGGSRSDEMKGCMCGKGSFAAKV